jgi:hypothetical protein
MRCGRRSARRRGARGTTLRGGTLGVAGVLDGAVWVSLEVPWCVWRGGTSSLKVKKRRRDHPPVDPAPSSRLQLVLAQSKWVRLHSIVSLDPS